MARLLNVGLMVLVVSTLAVPAVKADSQLTNQPQSAQPQSVESHSTQSQSTQPQVGDIRLQTNQQKPMKQADVRILSERDRLILERETQRLIPPQE